jgi:hypothetical protein
MRGVGGAAGAPGPGLRGRQLVGMLGSEELNRRLGYHPATTTTIPLFEDNRARFVELACHLDDSLPPGREAALAQTALQEALMWSNAAVACNLSPLEDPAGRQPNPLVESMAHNRVTQTLTLDVRIPDGLTPAAATEFIGRQVADQLERSAAEQSRRGGVPRV